MQLNDDLFLFSSNVTSLQVSSQVIDPPQSATLPTPQQPFEPPKKKEKKRKKRSRLHETETIYISTQVSLLENGNGNDITNQHSWAVTSMTLLR